MTVRKKVKHDYNVVRASIKYFMLHPRLTNRDRDYIMKSLKLIDRFSVNYTRNYKYSNLGSLKPSEEAFGKSKQLRAALQLNKDQTVILRESDKKLGWALNSATWYRDEYLRQLGTDFYKWVGKTNEASGIKKECRRELFSILVKHREVLGPGGETRFYSRKLEDYILPSMNLMPKVHKLSDPASPANEGDLKGRPIITAHSWSTVEASKFLQEKLRDILVDFKLFLSINGYQCPVLKDSKELLGALETLKLDNNESYTFVTFDFKDLYTNILYEDAKVTLKSLEKLEKNFTALKLCVQYVA